MAKPKAGADQAPAGAQLHDMHREVSIQFLEKSGGFAVRAERGQKAPGKDWDPKSNNEERSKKLIEQLRHSEDNLGIHLHGPLVDVDIDADNKVLLAGLDRFLPSCGHVWGRASRPRSHRVYQLRSGDWDPTNYPVLRRIKKLKECSVELRGGPQTRGEYSVLPGSVHPSGEHYEWADLSRARSGLAIAEADQLVSAVRRAAALAVLAPLWVEGIRNELGMALAGFFYRAWSVTQDIGSGAFALDYDGARSFYQTLLDVSGDDASDRRSRVLSFDATWQKAEKGAPVTGAARIAELTGDKDVPGKLYLLLSDSPDAYAIDEFIARFAIWQGPGMVIDMEKAALGEPRPMMTRQNFSNSFGYKTINVGEKKVKLTEVLFAMENVTRVAGLTFEPGEPPLVETRLGLKVNQWSGYEVAPHPEPQLGEDVKPFLDYMKDIVANGDEKCYRWALAWVANMFKYPRARSKTTLVLVGLPGAGKSFLGHSVITPIIGRHHSATTNSLDAVTREFNVAFDNKIFIQCDEAMNSRQRGAANKLKSLITDPYYMVEPKGVDPFEKPNHARFLLTSNSIDDAFYLSDAMDDRRYTVLHVSDRFAERQPEESAHRAMRSYWETLGAWCKGNLDRIHRYLRDYHYDPALIASPLVTDAKIRIIEQSWDHFDAWLAEWVARRHPLAEDNHQFWYEALPTADCSDRHIHRDEWPQWIARSALARDFQDFCRRRSQQSHHANNANEAQIGMNMARRGLAMADEVIKRRVTVFSERKRVNEVKQVRLYAFPSLQQVARYLERKFGVKYDIGHKERDHAERKSDEGKF